MPDGELGRERGGFLDPNAGQRDGDPRTPCVQTDGAQCAWCGVGLTDDDSFLLRVGARLCGRCAEDAGRIAAAQKQPER